MNHSGEWYNLLYHTQNPLPYGVKERIKKYDYGRPEKIKVFQTRTIAEACKDVQTLAYVSDCLSRFYQGDYGEICDEDTAANNTELDEGFGHVLARYKAKHSLTEDIYIDSHFSADMPLSELDYNNTMIMYCSER